MLRGAHPAAAQPLVQTLLEGHAPDDPGAPCVRVCFCPSELLDVPPQARVVLRSVDRDPAWLNRHRPVVQERSLAVFVWGNEEQLASLRTHAPDFLDWVSHRIDIPMFAPAHARARLRRVLTHSRWAALRGSPSLVASLGGTWHEVDASQPFGELFEAMTSSDVVVGSLEDDKDAWRLMIAHAQAQWAHRVLLVEPSVIPPVVPLVDARAARWEDLAETLRAHHRPYPRLEAALRDLEHEAVARRPLIVAPEPNFMEVLRTAAHREDARALGQAIDVGLTDVAEYWARRAWRDGDAPAGFVLLQLCLENANRLMLVGRSVQAQQALTETMTIAHELEPFLPKKIIEPKALAARALLAALANDPLEARRLANEAAPAASSAQRLLAIEFVRRGDERWDGGSVQEARPYYEQSLAALEELTDSEHGQALDRYSLAYALSRLGELSTHTNALEDAYAKLERSRSILDELARSDPTSPTIQHALSATYRRMAALFRRQQDLRRALEHCESAIAIAEHLLDQEPESTDAMDELAVCRHLYADLLLADDQPERSSRELSEAVELWATLDSERRLPANRRPVLEQLRNELLHDPD